MRIGIGKLILMLGLVYIVGLGVGFLGGLGGNQHYVNELQDVERICAQSHVSDNGYLEEQCGKGQDETHTEFLCDSTGTYCWLEVK